MVFCRRRDLLDQLGARAGAYPQRGHRDVQGGQAGRDRHRRRQAEPRRPEREGGQAVAT